MTHQGQPLPPPDEPTPTSNPVSLERGFTTTSYAQHLPFAHDVAHWLAPFIPEIAQSFTVTESGELFGATGLEWGVHWPPLLPSYMISEGNVLGSEHSTDVGAGHALHEGLFLEGKAGTGLIGGSLALTYQDPYGFITAGGVSGIAQHNPQATISLMYGYAIHDEEQILDDLDRFPELDPLTSWTLPFNPHLYPDWDPLQEWTQYGLRSDWDPLTNWIENLYGPYPDSMSEWNAVLETISPVFFSSTDYSTPEWGSWEYQQRRQQYEWRSNIETSHHTGEHGLAYGPSGINNGLARIPESGVWGDEETRAEVTAASQEFAEAMHGIPAILHTFADELEDVELQFLAASMGGGQSGDGGNDNNKKKDNKTQSGVSLPPTFLPPEEDDGGPPPAVKSGGGVVSAGKKLALQHGGITSGGLALVGEAGPELITLPGGTHVSPNSLTQSLLGEGMGRGRTINHVTVDIEGMTDTQELVRELRRELRMQGLDFAEIN